MKRVIYSLAIASAVGLAPPASAQQPPGAAAADSSDLHYYDRWPGVWYKVLGDSLEAEPTFRVRRGPGTSFLEDWRLVIDGKPTPSFGLRAWDPPTQTWRLIWVADPDYFQVWDGQKRTDGWYITRQFGEGSSAFLSRQAWILTASGELLRTIERSTDGGRSWTVRLRETFRQRGEPRYRPPNDASKLMGESSVALVPPSTTTGRPSWR